MPRPIRYCGNFSARTSWRYPRTKQLKKSGDRSSILENQKERSTPLSAVHPFAWQNDHLIASSELRLLPTQAGLLTGWGLFSTLRIYQGIPFALDDHWERLCRDGERLHVAMQELRPEVDRGFRSLIERNQAAESMARVYFIRNRGGLLDQPQPRPTDLLMFTLPLRSWGSSARLRLQPNGRQAASPFAGTKSLTWSHNLVLVEEAVAAGYDDVLLLNERGEVAECTAANIFVVQGGVLRTPPLSSGALPGVSRKVVLAEGARYGLRVEEATLRPDDLYAAEEVLITSSTREVQPVVAIGDRTIPQGPFAGRVAALFRQEVARYVAAHRGWAAQTASSPTA